jgi:hypothetical protein
MKIFPYPLSSAKLSLSIGFTCWWPRLVVNRKLTEFAKEQGATIWYARALCFQVEYSRWV